MKKQRIDALLLQRNLAPSRERARTTIMSGLVLVNNQRVDKPGTMVDEQAEIRLLGSVCPYVGRGGLKLEKALTVFEIDVQDIIAVDVGASTGGFTDCLLQRGAARVYAVDVGYGQLAWSIRSNPRVVIMERTNIRHLTPEMIGEPVDLAVIDVSFISLKLVLPVIRGLVKDDGQAVCLVKPQFEAGKDHVGKKGVVRNKETHRQVLASFMEYAADAGFSVHGLTYSPIKGPEGNIEFLACMTMRPGQASVDADSVVEMAHEALKN